MRKLGGKFELQVVTPGNISYVISQVIEPVATVSPGETIIIETQDGDVQWAGRHFP
jgi:acetamidase/formamidase